MLTEGQYANPTFFLDEIDKVTATQYDPLGALYALLEPGTARTHADLSWPFLHLDCSRINYIAACNEPSNIPAPIVSRLRRFDIPEPTAEQALIIASKIIGEEQKRHGAQVAFSDAAVDALCRLAPRRMRQIVQEALGRVLLHERDVVRAEDFPVAEKPRRSIGFLD
jgi:ATP-dependent Lon protease